MLLRPFLLAFVLSSCTTGTTHAATIDVSYNLVPLNAQLAIDQAASIWEGILVSDVPIKVLVSWAPLGTASLGITFPNGRKDFVGAPVPQTWYATALANAMTGTELDPGENDFEIYLSSSANWYFGTDANPGAGQYDLVSVALHEMGHGLGFVGLSKKVGSAGSFGLLLASDFSPLITTFPWPQLDTLPGIFDRFLQAQSLQLLTDVANPSDGLGSLLTSNQVRWSGAFGLAASGGAPIRIYSPGTFALGSSCLHLNESTYPTGNANELMTPFSAAGVANHWPGPICIGILHDIGWTVAPDVGIGAPDVSMAHLLCYPNPSSDEISLELPTSWPLEAVMVLDAFGRIVISASGTPYLNIADLSSGTYLVSAKTDLGTVRGQFIKE